MNKRSFDHEVILHSTDFPAGLIEGVRKLEEALDKEVWLLIQSGDHGKEGSLIDFDLFDRFVKCKAELPRSGEDGKSRLALLINSPGGLAEPAYRIAKLLRRECGGFLAVVPNRAKSAATLLALGADEIILGENAELGPLDAQVYDGDVEETWVSALDEIQAVTELQQSAIDTAWRVVVYLHQRTRKKVNTLLPHALRFAADVTKPLFEKIDAVKYSRQSRRIREAQDYAERLLWSRVEPEAAKQIARDLVQKYPTHEFVIDRDESCRVGQVGASLRDTLIRDRDESLEAILDWFQKNLDGFTAIGHFK